MLCWKDKRLVFLPECGGDRGKIWYVHGVMFLRHSVYIETFYLHILVWDEKT